MIHSLRYIIFFLRFEKVQKSPDMKGILFERLRTSTLMDAEIDEEIIEGGDDGHG